MIELTATIFGLLCVWLTIRQNLWCWPTGLIQVTLYLFVFYEAKLYSDLLLQGIYIVMQLYGWHHWLRPGRAAAHQLAVTRLPRRQLLLWVFLAIVGAAFWGGLMARYTDAAAPYPDALVVCEPGRPVASCPQETGKLVFLDRCRFRCHRRLPLQGPLSHHRPLCRLPRHGGRRPARMARHPELRRKHPP